jgi:hypothetical protein
MCSTDYDPCTVWEETTPKARKPHGCDECGLPIKVGHHYARVGNLFDGKWSTYHAHAECRALMLFVEDKVCGGHGSIPIHGLGEEIYNLHGYDGGRTADERDDLIAMGFGEVDPDDPEYLDASAKDVCEWLWDCIRAEYGPEGART